MPSTPAVGAAVVTRSQLGSSLRAYAEAANRVGAAHRWRPARESEAAQTWRSAAHDLRARTLVEADVHAITLVHSGIEHAVATAQSISAGKALLPHTLARTATEHLLRAQHLLDETATPRERIQRRLNEWLYAATESGFRSRGLLKSDVFVSMGLASDDLGLDQSKRLQDAHERAAAVGETITDRAPDGKKSRFLRVEGTPGRLSTMVLAETYTAGGAGGIPAFTIRSLSASVHGTEIGILPSFSNEAPADLSLGRVVVPKSEQLDPPTLAFNLLGVMLTLVNATDSIRTRFEWPSDPKVDRRCQLAKNTVIETWSAAVNSE